MENMSVKAKATAIAIITVSVIAFFILGWAEMSADKLETNEIPKPTILATVMPVSTPIPTVVPTLKPTATPKPTIKPRATPKPTPRPRVTSRPSVIKYNGIYDAVLIENYSLTRPKPYKQSSITNATIAARAVNGYIVNPGCIFSFNKVVGERSTNKGYVDAPTSTGHGPGGGVCFTSTGLY